MILRRFLSFPPSFTPQQRSNFRYFLQDIAVWSLFTGSTAIFLTIYASRCGATSGQIGLLTAVPSVIAAFLSLPVGSWIRRFSSQRVTVWSAFSSRIFYIFFAILPWILPVQRQFDGILVLAVVIVVPTTFINISFSQMLVEAVPSDWRGTVVAARSAIGSICTFLVTLLSGQILSRLPFPANYQVVFAMGFVGGMLTVYQIAHIRPLAPRGVGSTPKAEVLGPVPPSLADQKQRFFPVFSSQGRNYLRVIELLFGLNTISNMVAPLVPAVLVHRLGLTDELISIGSSISTMMVFLISLYIARITRRTGNRNGTSLGLGILALQTFALGFARDSTLYLVSTVLGGFASGTINIVATNYNLDHLPDTERSSWLSMSLLLGNIAVLLGSLGGPAIAAQIGTPAALILFGGLELVIGLVILKWG